MDTNMKPIQNYPHYFITKDGRVWSEARPRVRGTWLKSYNHKGYCRVKLRKDGRYCQQSIHRLVLETFVGPCPDGMECRHLNGNRSDNRVENLKWGTKSENSQDAIKHGTHVTQVRKSSTLTPFLVRMIRNWYATKLVTQAELGFLFGVCQQNIHKIVKYERWKGGY